jgi:hypothetical protein
MRLRRVKRLGIRAPCPPKGELSGGLLFFFAGNIQVTIFFAVQFCVNLNSDVLSTFSQIVDALILFKVFLF